jgi:cell division septation protein DedD
MAASHDTEITLGTAKLLGLFFGLVMVCAVFFALGYTLGRKSEGLVSPAQVASPAAAVASGSKPGSAAATPMTFYKAVEQTDANAQLTPAADVSTAGTPATVAQPAEGQAPTPAPANAPPAADAATPGAGSGYFVQVAAVSKQDDAGALVDALKKKQYPAFIATNLGDKLFRVQVGPFAEIKDAEAMRFRLVNDGYNPILKK